MGSTRGADLGPPHTHVPILEHTHAHINTKKPGVGVSSTPPFTGGAQKLSFTMPREESLLVESRQVMFRGSILPPSPPAPGVCPPKSLQGTVTCWGALSSVEAGACSVDVREVRVIAGIDLEEEGGDSQGPQPWEKYGVAFGASASNDLE